VVAILASPLAFFFSVFSAENVIAAVEALLVVNGETIRESVVVGRDVVAFDVVLLVGVVVVAALLDAPQALNFVNASFRPLSLFWPIPSGVNFEQS